MSRAVAVIERDRDARGRTVWYATDAEGKRTGRAHRTRASAARAAEAAIEDSASRAAVARYRLALVREPAESYECALGPEPEPVGFPAAAARFLWRVVEQEPGEVFGALYLDSRTRAIGYSVLYRGTIRSAPAEPRGVLSAALLCNAVSVVVFHNHPSGDPSPSAEDYSLTRRLAAAADAVGIRLVDHLILGNAHSFVSLAERGGW